MTEPVARISTFSPAVTLPVTAPMITTAFCGDRRLDVGAGTDGECVIGQRDTAFHLAIEGEVLGSAQLTLDDHRLPEIHDRLLRRPTIDSRGLRGQVPMPHSLISLPHARAHRFGLQTSPTPLSVSEALDLSTP